MKQVEDAWRALQRAAEMGQLYFDKGQSCTCSCVILYSYLYVKLTPWFCVFRYAEELVSPVAGVCWIGGWSATSSLVQASGSISLKT